ncbi:MerR family DNA-binding transcriptional regulator [Herbidospora sp. NBRC 101105]|uniref:MerR family DNA-binding transcriptional regulator n=1 Tax=Herbidospora sp. NBRC 101105 TaxID=3032195 RepID=UPI0024A19D01|nr:MerR family DNA-binding transcriptional regulator [Herbidospora sp. NBRC 101105]GLX96736.1 hypothetical protein Hesp01_46860 [Herbidospora sp. NBRC 101105]
MTHLRSGQVAQQAGVNPQTLRYYERRGLIAEPPRSPGGHRAYPPETVDLLIVIKAAQRLGFTRIDDRLAETSGRPNADKWTPEGLATDPGWIEVQHLSSQALTEIATLGLTTIPSPREL